MTIFNLPDLGEGLPEAEIHEWHVKPGDTVQVDQVLVSVETAKAIVEVPAPQSGVIKKLYGSVGSIIPTGSPLIEFESMENTQTSENEKTVKIDSGTVVGNLEQSDEFILPTAQLMAHPSIDSEKPISIEQPAVGVTESHPGQAGVVYKTVSGVRRQMAHTMAASHAQVVPVTLTEDAILPLEMQQSDFTVRMIQALNLACTKEPSVNAWFRSTQSGQFEYHVHDQLNLGLAVDSPAGLFVPVIHEVSKLSGLELREKINQLKTSIKNRSLEPASFTGATLILSNFGTFVGRYATPIVVPPMVAIFGVGRSRVVFVPDSKQKPVAKLLVPLVLTFDHRAVTGGEAARFMQAVIENLSD